ncbi:MAG TPA: tetratricopeptide repeat protein [Polyangia bacterium]|nr:tetratricopeptide repeat protein [Polyangia bacterium]
MLTKKDKHLAAAQKYLERGQDQRALEEFARVVQEDPADTRTWLKMAEIHVRRGALAEAREIYLRTAEIYIAQGFLPKAATVYKSVLKLTPGLPHVRIQLGELYRRMGMVSDALGELEAAARELLQAGRSGDALPALRRIVELHPDNVVSRIRLAEAASKAGRTDEAIGALTEAADQLRREGRADEFLRVAERLLFHQPENHALARELAASYIERKNPRLALAKLQRPLRAAPRDPDNVALLAQALETLDPRNAVSVWRELAEIHADAGREAGRDAAVRAALALDPTNGESREMAARWGISLAAAAARARVPPPPRVRGSVSSAVTGVDPRAPAPAPPEGAPVAIRPSPSGPYPDDVSRIVSEAEVFVKYGLGERAVDHLRRVFAIEPHHRGARERLASVLAQIGRKSEAAAELVAVARQLRAAADETGARSALEQALALDPDSAEAARMLGRQSSSDDELMLELEQLDFFAQQALHDEARAALVDLERRFPGHPLVIERRRRVDADDVAGAIPTEAASAGVASTAAPVARLSPSERADPATHGDLGIAYKQMGLWDAAIQEFKLLAADTARAVFALTMIGECVEAKGDLGGAVARYKEALNLPQATVQESIGLYYQLGAVFEQLGDVREALYFFESVGKRDPGFRDVQRRIAALKVAPAAAPRR